MNFWESVFLGVLQGFTEFLPVSSSGHLILVSKLFNIESNLFFDVMLHFGTLIAVILVYFKSIKALFTLNGRKKLLLLVIASIPTFIIAFVVKLFVKEDLLTSLLPIGFALTIVLLVLNNILHKEKFSVTQKYLPAVICGVVQGIAVMPGLSRSGSTISTLGVFGVKSEECGEFSFLLSIPVILGSVVVEGYQALTAPTATNWILVVVGVVVSGVSGFIALKLVNKILNSSKFVYFAFYLVIPLILSILVM